MSDLFEEDEHVTVQVGATAFGETAVDAVALFSMSNGIYGIPLKKDGSPSKTPNPRLRNKKGEFLELKSLTAEQKKELKKTLHEMFAGITPLVYFFVFLFIFLQRSVFSHREIPRREVRRTRRPSHFRPVPCSSTCQGRQVALSVQRCG